MKTLEVRSLELSRPHGKILRGIDLDAAPGELVGLLGQSGSGKTTVLRAIAALEPFDGGSIQLDGVTLEPGPLPRESRLRALRERVGIVFQHRYLFEHLTALDNVTLAPVHVRGLNSAVARNRAEELLESLGVAHRAQAFPRELSGGEAQRVAIARALILDPHLLLMDEPTAALDPARRNSLGELLRELTKTGRAIVMATHDLEFARTFASRVVTLSEGRIA